MTVLVGLRDATGGQLVLDRAIEEAQRRDARLLLVSVVEQAPRSAGPDDAADREHRREELDALAGAVAAEHAITVDVRVPAGYDDAGRAILDLARDQQADLIVIGKRRRSRVGKLLLGSTAQDVLLGAECPVLAVQESS